MYKSKYAISLRKGNFMKKSALAIIVSLMVTAACSPSMAADRKTVSVVVNNTPIEQSGIIQDNRTLVPVRGVFEWLGYTVNWDAETKTASLYGNNFVIEIQSGANYFTCLNSKTKATAKITPDVPQQIIDGHFYIPLRAISEATGAAVDWDSANSCAIITTTTQGKIDTEQSSVSTPSVDEGINYDSFKSSYIKDYLKSNGFEYSYQITNIPYMDLTTEALNSDTMEDLKQFTNLQKVTFRGNEVNDYSPLIEYFDENSSSAVSFRIPNRAEPITKENISVYKAYTDLNREIFNQIIDENDSDLEKIQAIHDYLVLNTDYDIDNFNSGNVPDEDYDPYYVLKNHKAVCAGYARAAAGLLELAGIESIYVRGTAGNDGGWGSHEWLMVKLDGQYYHLDVTFDDPIINDQTIPDYIDWTHFLKSDSTMSKNHKWDRNEYPECKSDYDFTPPYDYWETHKKDLYGDNYYDDETVIYGDEYEDYDDPIIEEDTPDGTIVTEYGYKDGKEYIIGQYIYKDGKPYPLDEYDFSENYATDTDEDFIPEDNLYDEYIME